MASRTIENYLKQVYLEAQQSHEGVVVMGRLAQVMGVVPGTATSMVKALADSGLVDYEPRLGVRLTRAGEQLALHVLRRHRLVELFLVQVVGLDWSEVHPEAEELEHAISDKVLERFDALLGYPVTDPHGDPIPTSAGQVPVQQLADLTLCPLDAKMIIARVIDQDPAFLQYVSQRGLIPGKAVWVRQRHTLSDALEVELDAQQRVTLSMTAARKFLVTVPAVGGAA
jgi:DtxR family Mn-dependent transcriptional regulator